MQPPARRFLTDPIFASLTRWLNIDPASLPESFPPDFLLHAMDAAGVEQATVSAWHGSSGVIISNAEIAALVKAHPDRLVGLASVDLARPMEAGRELRRAGEFDGARGRAASSGRSEGIMRPGLCRLLSLVSERDRSA